MTTHANNIEVMTPSLPKGGGAIQSIGTGWGAVGMTGQASFDVPLPLSPGRAFTPALSLSYRSTLGNGPFGIGWDLSAGAIVRNTLKGVPTYTDKDEFISHTGAELIPERTTQGALNTTTVNHYNDFQLRVTHTVLRYLPCVESTFERIEHWSSSEDPAGFWLVQSPDGNTHLFGKTTAARCADPAAPDHVVQWHLQESLSAHGEQIYYHYKSAEQHSSQPAVRDFRAQRYLARVCYANLKAQTHFMLWATDTPADNQWHFELVLDYGERPAGRRDTPSYAEQRPWQPRQDPFFSYAYGFELGHQYLCRQVLMFHYFPDEAAMGPAPVLVRRLMLQYRWTEGAGNLLRTLVSQAYDADGPPAEWPPLTLSYSPFTLKAEPKQFQAFEALNVPDHASGYQLVDLYNDGLPGVLSRADKSWYYREPIRATQPAKGDAISYGEAQLLANIPVADKNQAAVQALSDLNGDGQLDWIVAQPGMSGFFTLKGNRSWSGFVPFAAFPQEFFHPTSQLVDLMGNGIYDLALIGSHSVRIYINQGTAGFEAGKVIPHIPDEAALPQPGNSATELVAFTDLLGSGQQHLIRIRHDHIQCWPNLGGGHFGKGFEFASLPFSYASFDPERVLLADLDGSGASDLLYLEPDKVLIFMSRFGHGLQPPVQLKWPDGVFYDRFCQVTTADLQGLGCSSLVMSTSQGATRHWRYDFVSQKPYLLTTTENHMGARGELNYRSSAQEWLDEKREHHQANKQQISGLPFPLHVVTQQQQFDLISGNQIAQRFQYREGFYDPGERKFQGFGLLIETDAHTGPNQALEAGHTGALLRKAWFHTGKDLDMSRSDYNQSDKSAQTLGLTLLGRLEPGNLQDRLILTPSAADVHAMKKALSGSPLREEIYAADDPAATAVPYTVSQQRYLVRQLGSTDSVLLLPLESVSYRYEREPDDPACSHTLNLARDAYGSLLHGMTVNYARRKRVTDAAPFSDPHQQKWWRDTHDPAQQADYLTEIRAQPIHLDAPQRWRLGLPYRQRSNALVLEKGSLSHISYEHFIANTPDNPVGANAKWVLAGASVQYYCLAHRTVSLPAGQASFEALPHHVESAELDEHALTVYEDVPHMPGSGPYDLEKELVRAHYHPMTLFLPDPGPNVPEQSAKTTLWSLKLGFAVYDDAAGFYRANYFRATQCHGVTVVGHDPYKCLLNWVKTADGCTTTAVYDYRSLMPVHITDAQGTVQQARYNAFGQLLATSFYGREEGKAVGFETLDNYVRPANDTPEMAIANPTDALMKAASACFYAPFSWMQKREPVHVAVLQADRYSTDTGDVEPIIRISVASSDGSGRVLQNKQKTVPGPAYQVDPGGVLKLDATGRPLTLESSQRWRVSARVEYNNKGLAIRNYRPYFADHWHSINDASLREGGYSDQLFYDPLGRLIKTINASGDMSRQTYCTWYTISEDENDTYEPPSTAS